MDKILILDFGSQYNQLIARRIREMDVYCEVHPYDVDMDFIKKFNPRGIILSGGPESVGDKNSYRLNSRIYESGIPVLGICYGMQLAAMHFGAKIKSGKKREYGRAMVYNDAPNSPIFRKISEKTKVWMSHSDYVDSLPEGFYRIAHTESVENAAIGNDERRVYLVQFHPEVKHTVEGSALIANFLFNVCEVKAQWKMKDFIKEQVENIRSEVGDSKVVLGLSGGVDSSVTAAIVGKAIGKQLNAVFVDNGLLRADDRKMVEENFKHIVNLDIVDSREEFIAKLKGVTDPEKKRKIIGHTFIDVFEKESERIKGVEFLAQGTIYPDIIESSSNKKGHSKTIKSHHNVGGLPEKMSLKLLEPLKTLFKDEVRALGRELGLSETLVNRHPFPGPGLAVRIPGEVSAEKCEILKKVDSIFIDMIREAGLYDEISQAFAVLLPVRSVGVMGDRRTYNYVAALRAVETEDFMTADWYDFSHEFLKNVSTKIINEVADVNRVVYDISSKPPATVEWE